MENPGLLHIGERILKNVPFRTKLKCRLVKRSWNQIFEKEASKAKNDLDNLIKSIRESTIRPEFNEDEEVSEYCKMLSKYESRIIWMNFVMHLRSKTNKVVNVLLKELISYQFNTGFSSLPLEQFVMKRDMELVNLTIKQKLYDGFVFDKALQIAIQNRYTDIVQCLKPFMTLKHLRKYVLEPTRSGDINALKIVYPNPKEHLVVDRFGANPIHIAAYMGHIRIVGYFIENTEGLTAQDNSGFTPLCYAIINCYHSIFLMITKVVPEDHILKPIMNGKNVIHIAAESGKLEVVSQLCEKVKNPILPDDMGNTPIHYAAYIGHLEMLKLLVPYGTDLMIPNQHDKTPLQLAMTNGHTEAAKYLVECEQRQNKGEMKS